MESQGEQPTPQAPSTNEPTAQMPVRPEPDKLNQHETILLYGLSAGRCAKCKTPVVRESCVSGKAYNLGKRAHMVGRSDVGPRGDPDIPITQRRDLRNHLLLCGICHDEIDRDVEAWPIERLLELRDEHQAWVARLDEEASVDHERLVYANSIDAACELVWLDAWTAWTQNMLHPALSWRLGQVDAAVEFSRRMNTTDWPKTLPELEVALLRLAHLLNEAASTFGSRADLRDAGDLHVLRHYKRGFNPNYHRDLEEFTDWLEQYEGLIFEATKAANWVRIAWRAAANPEFMAGKRVHLITGPHGDLRHQIHVLEYSPDEKRELLDAGRDGIRFVPTLRLDFRPQQDGIDRLVHRIMEDLLGVEPAFDVVEELARRIRGLEHPTDTATLFRDLPGRMLPARDRKRITAELLRHAVLRRNTAGRGFVRGETPE